MIELHYQLTPATGDKLRDAEVAAEQANVMALVDGDGMMYTSQGHNMQAHLATAQVRREARYDHGAFSMSDSPYVTGMKIAVPRMYARVRGASFLLEGPMPDGSQLLDFAPLGDGPYAVVVETWLSLVGPTTFGKASRPAQFAGVEDVTHKPNKDALYPAGNIDRLHESGVRDDPFVTATIQTQKMIQRQYRLVVIPDCDLAGWRGIDGAIYQPDSMSAPHGVRCLTEYGENAYDRAYDRELLAFKLCVVERAGNTLRVHVNDVLVPDDYTPVGQRPVPVVPTPSLLASRLQYRLRSAQEQIDELGTRLQRAEATMQVMRASNPDEQTLQTSALSASGQRIPFSMEERDDGGWHDPQGAPASMRPRLEGELEVHATVAFDASPAGSRRLALLLDGAPVASVSTPACADGPTELNVSAVVGVKPTSLIEVAAWQSSGLPLRLLARRSRISVRRVR